MSQLTIQTEFDNRAFVPGDVLRGTVSWQLNESTDMALRLFYYTVGKGTRDVKIVESREFPASSMADQQGFEFTLPNEPFSFSGELVSLVWALELEQVDGKGSTERLEFVLSPTGQEIDLYAFATEDMPNSKKGVAIKFGH